MGWVRLIGRGLCLVQLFLVQLCVAQLCLAGICAAQSVEVRAPSGVVAGEGATISSSGSGKRTFYLIGPGVSLKRDVNLGEQIQLDAKETQHAGDYRAIVCSDLCGSATFYVRAGQPASLSFLVHPSRVPVSLSDAVSGVAFSFDQYRNLVLAAETIDFRLAAGNASLFSKAVLTKDGVAWFRTTSGRSAGALQVVAGLDDLSARRVVQQVASDPCNLRIEGQRTKAGIVVQTQPVHDCAGNPVPDGTIVTFTATDASGKSTVDAPIKQGIARAQIEGDGAAVISVASGVVLGNELRVGAQP